MTKRINAVKPTYRPIKNTEMVPVADIYKALISATGVLLVFTGENSTIDATWVTAFDGSITAVGNIVPSRTIRTLNKGITRSIKEASKKSVKYGKKLSIFLDKAFLPSQPEVVESFPIIQANEKMRDGETEGFMYFVNIIIEQLTVPANQAALVAKGWPPSNLADYQALYDSVRALNTQQEMAKILVPENTDAATTIRNACYAYIHELSLTKDLVYDNDKQKKHAWSVSTILKQIRSSGAGGVTQEGDVTLLEIDDVDTSSVHENPAANVTIIITGGSVNISAANATGAITGPTQWTVAAGTVVKTQAQFAALIGLGGANTFVKVQGIGPGSVHWKIVFAG